MNITVSLKEYINTEGKSHFAKWFASLKHMEAVKVGTALYRLEQGNFSNVEGVGEGVFEYKIDYGSGYRVYFGQDGEALVILLCGGTKKRQSKDIEKAKTLWKEYKRLKKLEKRGTTCH
jgi:putative addiction module killer protein